MARDPLSPSSRKARTTFLIVRAGSAAASVFGIELKDLEAMTIPNSQAATTIVLI